MDDLIYRWEAIEACNQQTMDCNPDHFNGHEHFTEFLDDATIGSFGKWQFANGFNVGVMAARVAIKNIDPAHGRLVDADKLEEEIDFSLQQVNAYLDNIDADYYSAEYREMEARAECYRDALEYIRDAPTVIPKEEP